ncbi:hypothetical protein A3C09_03725 [Candidatus Uhrbacteria bacterium RIFCSPHIGHO2_02_FULL_47_44]|uniref:Uncharacterized protein n=1 Tax=Candidatus Uhrbacteria bacterium RIFCSPLOWO2_02_FULL_48_18 TaxID=1802408 RepID=A0A1F7V708_9BACT|nr:MAG: hypothetical protein A2839_05435 [Candidatus Uhrbacteria bacterium RIFCSPHIGHO2_01_FULL_47_10]OGL71316.1 MAG: hypothetical protein A3C09_03725 [Candidatus Uhrbacteria bacterium RIFCSPHIGHO2_02_FULL_47_44]OGL77602.1 MAG: hypothetical protein A3E97_04980 [Candidatus Uhrbacteria bacterium RIFCSPHIGHO2_12_FULL_47_12]OGL80410.1 MAG: hypothetical protein A3B20_03275 [Candidatus Uhrbacteria bacterium RIFCSPLOWO2_01_FULL_47_17]OGL86270.1 MAG: hypothetical protein A3I41_01760 [Candidatus Uhrbact
MSNPCVICGGEVVDLSNALILPIGVMNKKLGRRAGVADLTQFLLHADCRPFPYLGTLARVAENEERARKSREWEVRLARRHVRNLPKDAETQILNGVWPVYLPKKESLLARERGNVKPEGEPAEKSNGVPKGGEPVTA